MIGFPKTFTPPLTPPRQGEGSPVARKRHGDSPPASVGTSSAVKP